MAFATCAAADDSRTLFKRFEVDDFFPLEAGEPVSGWIAKSENGKKYHSAVLNRQVDEVVKLGSEGFLEAFKHLDHPQMYIRYIAGVSLQRITKRQPHWTPHTLPDKELNGNTTWLIDAKAEWKSWYEVTAKIKAEHEPGSSRGDHQP